MSREIVVLQSFPEPRATTNPYIVMLARSVAAVPGTRLRTFTWRAALTGRIDVFHVHWPEILLRGPSALKTLRRQLLFVVFLARIVLTRVAVVRTMHNTTPHDGVTRREAVLLDALDRLTTGRIAINSAGEPTVGDLGAVIVHGHYRDWYAPYDKPSALPGRIGTFGLLKPYKGLDLLIKAFRAAVASGAVLSLRIAGRPASEDFATELRSLAAGEESIELTLSYIDDADLVRLTSESEVVAFPYREMYNSGGVLAALSLDRPVLVPENEVNRQLAAEVGPGWVHMFRGDLTGRHLIDALSAARARPRGARPDLSAREWANSGADHVAFYRRVLESRWRRSRAVAELVARKKGTQRRG